MDSFFYTNIDIDTLNNAAKLFVEEIKRNANSNFRQTTLINRPLVDPKFEYAYDRGAILLLPGYKCLFMDLGNNSDKFNQFCDDFLEDLGYISEKYSYKKILGRPREWKSNFFERLGYSQIENLNIDNKLEEIKLLEEENIRISEMLISLLIGSINQIDKIFCENNLPQDLLERVKKKIILFDADQTRFIYQEPKKKRILIQGLAGTGKTELLLHKLKDLYLNTSNSKIFFTCHNKILAKNLKNRISNFFDFMKVEEQIKWEERLWTISSWGSRFDGNSGVYSYICQYYNLTFYTYFEAKSFKIACQKAIEELNSYKEDRVYFEKNNKIDENGELRKCFDYILIDEGQDFPEEFFKLCEMVTEKTVYVAGDIFQNIFDRDIIGNVAPDFLLNKCYRTDPRTLMFAQGLGMGLFDQKPPLRWLKDDEWNACGYNITRNNNNVILSRTPLRRFEDLQDFESMEIIQSSQDDYLNKIIEIINKIKENYKTVLPDDIAIIFLEEKNNNNYFLANQLSVILKEKYGWDVNKGYETKEKINNTLFISNRNNVKGLEFPFVICITRNSIDNSMKNRNSIYMMLTRSFLTSYFIIPDIDEKIPQYINGLMEINTNGNLNVIEPTEEEKDKIMDIMINQENLNKSIKEIVDEIIEEKNIEKGKTKKIYEIVKAVIGENEEWNKELIERIISLNEELF